MSKLIMVRAAIVRHCKTSVRFTCKWPTTWMLLLSFARQTLVCCTIIVRHKYGSYGHRTFQVIARLQTKLYVTLTTVTSHVHLPYVTLSIISTRFFMVRSATGATTGKTRSTRTFTKHVRPVVTKALAIQYIFHRKGTYIVFIKLLGVVFFP